MNEDETIGCLVRSGLYMGLVSLGLSVGLYVGGCAVKYNVSEALNGARVVEAREVETKSRNSLVLETLTGDGSILIEDSSRKGVYVTLDEANDKSDHQLREEILGNYRILKSKEEGK
tara:strand:+ start:197 stop:547 length:351 start_codon:yes stop_codon:yes gene_type:complete